MASIACQTDLTMQDLTNKDRDMDMLYQELYQVREIKDNIKKRVLLPDTLENNDYLLKFYTGMIMINASIYKINVCIIV